MGFDGSLRQNLNAQRTRMSVPPGSYMSPPRAPPMMAAGAALPNQLQMGLGQVPLQMQQQLQQIQQQQQLQQQQLQHSPLQLQAANMAPSPQEYMGATDESLNGMDVGNGAEKCEAAPPALIGGPSLAERVNTLRLGGLGFDVTFVLGAPPSTTAVKAHRVVMAAGSKFFQKLFYEGDESPAVKKKKGDFLPDSSSMVVDFPDVDAGAFQTLVDYLYSDFDRNAINIDEAALLHTLYIARKFEMEHLESACVSLLGDLTPGRAVSLIEQAIKFQSDELLERCFQIIDDQTDDALSSDAILTVQRDTLKSIVSRTELSPSDEIAVFRAICAWADAECKRHGIEVTPQRKRSMLEDLFNEIRFPTMTVEEFGEAANSGMLTDDEIGVMFRYLTATVHTGMKLPFITQERRLCGRSKFAVRRFMNLSKNNCRKQRSTIWFIVNREILVTALGIYGLTNSETNDEGTEWETTIDIELACSTQNLVKESNTVTLKGNYGDGRVYIARFKKPAHVIPNVPHRVTVTFHEEVETFSGGNGVEDLRVLVGGTGGSGFGASESTSTNTNSVCSSSAASVLFAFHNDDPNGVRRGMTRGPAVFTGAIGGFYNRPAKGVAPLVSEGCLYEGQIPEIHFLAPNELKKESDA